jgi:hypothetical protein
MYGKLQQTQAVISYLVSQLQLFSVVICNPILETQEIMSWQSGQKGVRGHGWWMEDDK